MALLPDNTQELLAELRKARDELRVQINLAAAEIREDWDALEHKWEHFRSRAEQVGETTGEAAEEVGEALGLVGEELRKGYQQIKKAL